MVASPTMTLLERRRAAGDDGGGGAAELCRPCCSEAMPQEATPHHRAQMKTTRCLPKSSSLPGREIVPPSGEWRALMKGRMSRIFQNRVEEGPPDQRRRPPH